jgi:hypothetical protein
MNNPQFIETFKSLTPITPLQPIITPLKGVQTNKPEGQDCERERCMQCKKNLDNNFVKSVFRNKEVRFCDYECLEKNKAFK